MEREVQVGRLRADLPQVLGAMHVTLPPLREHKAFRARKRALAAFERRYITRLLEKNGGNVLRAAAHSGIALRYFQQVKARHGVGRGPGDDG